MRLLHSKKFLGLLSFLFVSSVVWGGVNQFDLLKGNRLDVDNVRIDGNTVSTTNTNGTLLLSPNGSGSVKSLASQLVFHRFNDAYWVDALRIDADQDVLASSGFVIGTSEHTQSGFNGYPFYLMTGGDQIGGNGITGSLHLSSGVKTAGTGGTGALFINTGIITAPATGDSGAIDIESGDTSTGNTGYIRIHTGVPDVGNSGEIELRTSDPSTSGTRGKILLVNGSEGTIGHVWTSVDVNGGGEWSDPASLAVINTHDFTSNDTWVVPAGITKIWVLACGSGGGGGGGAGSSSNATAGGSGGGSGGAGAQPRLVIKTVVPADTLTITIPAGGAGGAIAGIGVAGHAGVAGTASTVTGTGIALSFAGAAGGTAGALGTAVANPGAGGAAVASAWAPTKEQVGAGAGGDGGAVGVGAAGDDGAAGFYALGGAGGVAGASGNNTGGGGGGGGAGYSTGGAGANGGTDSVAPATGSPGAANSCAGGGGGGGSSSDTSKAGSAGGQGGSGHVTFYWFAS